MGSGSKTVHATYDTAPTALATTEAEAGGEGLPAQEEPLVSTELPEHLAQLDVVIAELQALAGGPADSLGDWYTALQEGTATAQDLLTKADASGLPGPAHEAYAKQLREATTGALGGLDTDALQQLAASQGFQAPELVGLNHSDGKQHPLVHWLDPVYPSTASKDKIQAKALERLGELCKGSTIAGKTLADVTIPKNPDGTWTATEAHFLLLSKDLSAEAAAFHAIAPSEHTVLGILLQEMVERESKLATAHVEGMPPADVTAAKAAAQNTVDQAIELLSPHSHTFNALLDHAEQQGQLTAGQRSVLSNVSAVALVRETSPEAVKQALAATAELRLEETHAVKTAWAGLQGYLNGENKLASLGPDFSPKTPDSYAQPVSDVATLAASYFKNVEAVHQWVGEVKGEYESLTGVHADSLTPGELTSNFTQWTVGKSTAGLKLAAEQLGMQGTHAATKAHVKQFIASQWDPSLDAKAIQDTVTSKALGTKVAPAKPAAKTPTASGSAATVAGFAAKTSTLVDALQKHHAFAADVPKPLDAAVVAAHEFGTGTSASSLGGVHTKSLHLGPDGGMWMFKPDKAGGARAHAEAAASRIYAAAGIAAVPVYTVTINGKPGVVQPLIKNTTQLDPSPSSWSQGDVDALVRTHVAAWVMGDHDANPDNILTTSSGGLLPVDAGQSFKHWGKDTLAVTFHPNAKFGSSPPAHHLAYKAAQSGGLAPGVTIKPAVAHPVITALEKIPDSQWRSMLHTVAHEGAKSKTIEWMPTMRNRAAKTHGIAPSEVSTSQIAAEFLDHACERKAHLRESFTSFFTALGVDGVDGSALKYGA